MCPDKTIVSILYITFNCVNILLCRHSAVTNITSSLKRTIYIYIYIYIYRRPWKTLDTGLKH